MVSAGYFVEIEVRSGVTPSIVSTDELDFLEQELAIIRQLMIQ